MIDMNKEYVTKGEGLPVRLYAVGCAGRESVHGAMFRNGEWITMGWNDDGLFYGEYDDAEPAFDLIEKPQTITRWVNVYEVETEFGKSHISRGSADSAAYFHRLGVLRIEYTGDKYEVFKEDV